uniref:Uncharacterized protein MANES_15G177200 n=1 Tax=Rhizophora mucronata TaxID=61149 RepID=A0A2P2IYN4_RHIMU
MAPGIEEKCYRGSCYFVDLKGHVVGPFKKSRLHFNFLCTPSIGNKVAIVLNDRIEIHTIGLKRMGWSLCKRKRNHN